MGTTMTRDDLGATIILPNENPQLAANHDSRIDEHISINNFWQSAEIIPLLLFDKDILFVGPIQENINIYHNAIEI